MTKKADKYGWMKKQIYRGSDRKGHYNFYRHTVNKDITMWITKGETTGEYLVEKSTHLGDYQFENKTITQFKTAVLAKEWVNKEYAHMFEEN